MDIIDLALLLDEDDDDQCTWTRSDVMLREQDSLVGGAPEDDDQIQLVFDDLRTLIDCRDTPFTMATIFATFSAWKYSGTVLIGLGPDIILPETVFVNGKHYDLNYKITRESFRLIYGCRLNLIRYCVKFTDFKLNTQNVECMVEIFKYTCL